MKTAATAIIRYLLVTATTASLLLISSAAASQATPVADYFLSKNDTGGTGAFRSEHNDIYVRLPDGKLEYLGSTSAGPPRGVGFLGDQALALRTINTAVSNDGRSIVFRHRAGADRRGSDLESGIYRYVYGGGLKLLHKLDALSGESYSHWEKPLPADILPFKYKVTYTKKDLLWALKANGEQFPLALLEASPLHWAAFDGRTDACTALIKSGSDINAKTYWGFTPLDLAIIRDHEQTAISLLALAAKPDAGIYPAFHRAVMLGRMQVVQFMLARGVAVNDADAWGYTPLHLAIFAGTRLVGGVNRFFEHAETPRSMIDKNITTLLVQLLLENGADTAIRDKAGKTPLDAISTNTPAEVEAYLSGRPGERQ